MATYQAVVAQTQSSSSSSNLCCSVATQTWSAHHVACSLLHTNNHYASSMNAVWRTPIQPRPQTALLLLLLFISSRTRSSKQPIVRIEDRLFDRGWVRSAMVTRKCGNVYFRKYFMAVRKFTNIFVLLLILMVGSRDTLFLVCFT